MRIRLAGHLSVRINYGPCSRLGAPCCALQKFASCWVRAVLTGNVFCRFACAVDVVCSNRFDKAGGLAALATQPFVSQRVDVNVPRHPSSIGTHRVHSSVVRAADCRSAGPWFKSGCALYCVPRKAAIKLPDHAALREHHLRSGAHCHPSRCDVCHCLHTGLNHDRRDTLLGTL